MTIGKKEHPIAYDHYDTDHIGRFRMVSPVTVYVEKYADGEMVLQCIHLQVVGYGKNRELAEKDLAEELEFAWHTYAEGDVRDLTEMGKAYGDSLRRYVKTF